MDRYFDLIKVAALLGASVSPVLENLREESQPKCTLLQPAKCVAGFAANHLRDTCHEN
jgi:hypothetical protein